MRYPGKILLISLFFCLPLIVSGQDDKFYIETRPSVSSIASGKEFSIEYLLKFRGNNLTLNNPNIQVRKPDLKEFVIVDEYRGNGMQFDFGSSGITVLNYTLVLKSRSEGKKTIDPLTIVMNGNEYVSNSVNINFTKGTPGQDVQEQAPEIGDKQLFAKMTVSKPNPYAGEQVVVTHYIYSAVNLVSFGEVRFPGFEGFLKEEVPSKEVKLSTKTIDNIRYRVVELQKHIIVPRNSGSLRISPLEVECVVQQVRQRPARNRQERMFYGPTVRYRDNVTYQVKSPAITLNVKPLPSTGRPGDFQDIVGAYTFKVEADKTEALTNDAITFKYTVSGKGYLSTVEPLEFTFPPDFEVYDPKLSTNYKATGQGLTGSKTWSWLLIPRREGDYSIPGSAITAFDPLRGEYTVQHLPGFDFAISKGEGSASMVTVSGTTQEDIQFIGQDIRFIHTGLRTGSPLLAINLSNTWSYLLWLLPILALSAFLIITRHRGTQEALISRTQRKASGRAGKMLRAAAKYRLTDTAGYHERVSLAVYSYGHQRFQIPRSELTVSRLCERLTELGVSEESVNQLGKFMDACEYNRYAPPVDHAMNDALHTTALNLINEIEKQL